VSSYIENRVCITLDVDWANDNILDYTLNKLNKYGVKATFFSTHDSVILKGLDQDKFEIGLHPNFNNSNCDFEEPIKTLKDIYPQAVGARSHSLFVSSNILQNYKKHGLRYESNNFLYLHPNLQITKRFYNFYSIPFFWSDDKLIELENKEKNTYLRVKGLKIYNFHPIHIFLNTPKNHYYNIHKHNYHNDEELLKNRFRGFGVGTYFENILKEIYSQTTKTYLMKELIKLGQ
jgi:peptidoglycan/xylan/chitin deacetylase (PgdA/CDA1 family)